MCSIYRLFWHCVSVCVRFLSGSCLYGPSATRPAATFKASTTWSRRSSSSTSSSTSVSTSSNHPSLFPSLCLWSLSLKLSYPLCEMLFISWSVIFSPAPLCSSPEYYLFIAGKAYQFIYRFITTGHSRVDPGTLFHISLAVELFLLLCSVFSLQFAFLTYAFRFIVVIRWYVCTLYSISERAWHA